MAKKASNEVWDTIKVEFINGASYSDLSDAYNIPEGTIRQRSSRGRWPDERNKLSRAVTEQAISMIAKERAKQLALWNEEDIRLARALRSRIAQRLIDSKDLNMAEIRTMIATVDLAQKVARLAFGEVTEHQMVTNRELPASIDEFVA